MTTQYPEPQYALWSDPETSSPVVYSLPALRDIEFACEDGFRKIPHGGLEVGGLLLGQVQGDFIYIEGFRDIECEHARGPSFVLSEKDVNKLREQLIFLESDPEAAGLRPVGWFISHARSQLQMHQGEVDLFNELFPGHAVTVLLRPGSVGPFPLSFFIRDATGSIDLDGTGNAILLPTVTEGVAADRDNPIDSIPAPIRDTAPARPKSVPVAEPAEPAIAEAEPEIVEVVEAEDTPEWVEVEDPELVEVEDLKLVEVGEYEILEAEEAPPSEPISATETTVPSASEETEPVSPTPTFMDEPEKPVENHVEQKTAEPVEEPETVVAHQPPIVVDDNKPKEPEPKDFKGIEPEVLEPAPEKPKPPKSAKWSKRASANEAVAAAEISTSTALTEIPPRPSVSDKAEVPRVHDVPDEPIDDRTTADVFNAFWARPSLAARLRKSRMTVAAILIFAAVIGSAIGYWAYSRLPSATIPLRIDTLASDLVITWPAAETRGSAYAALRIDNSDPAPLSEADKAAGHTQLKIPADNVKIELIARHWMRDSRGIIRYINGASSTASAPETTPPPTKSPAQGSAGKRRR